MVLVSGVTARSTVVGRHAGAGPTRESSKAPMSAMVLMGLGTPSRSSPPEMLGSATFSTGEPMLGTKSLKVGPTNPS
ncbi:MAG: hypothetical protein BWX80_03387 [Candidatus Hydrogenedentes bacterium ADurb.Bin101]|nr:MAG: hypothetical protein BWX80_03387 [Candidatus Hydrogenedentes bacterium ADurb.Bin101]